MQVSSVLTILNPAKNSLVSTLHLKQYITVHREPFTEHRFISCTWRVTKIKTFIIL